MVKVDAELVGATVVKAEVRIGMVTKGRRRVSWKRNKAIGWFKEGLESSVKGRVSLEICCQRMLPEGCRKRLPEAASAYVSVDGLFRNQKALTLERPCILTAARRESIWTALLGARRRISDPGLDRSGAKVVGELKLGSRSNTTAQGLIQPCPAWENPRYGKGLFRAPFWQRRALGS